MQISQPLLCTLHILQAIWRWLSDTAHQIEKQGTLTFMILFRDVAYAKIQWTVNYVKIIFMKIQLLKDMTKIVVVQLLNRQQVARNIQLVLGR